MPYKSEAQRRFFNSPAGREKIGEEEVEHWNEVSKGKKLPEKAVDRAIRMCDIQFVSYGEALRYCRQHGIEESSIKDNGYGFEVNEKKKPKATSVVYKYKADKYANYGRKQEYIETITFYSGFKNIEEARRDKQRIVGGNYSLKNMKFISKEEV